MPFTDKIDSTLLGMHSGVPPHMLPPNQLSFAVNITNRGGHPKTRPALRKLTVTYENEQTQTRATQAMWQVAGFYEGFGNNRNCLLTSIGGRVFRWLITNNSAAVSDISGGLAELNNPTNEQAWYFYGEGFGIINDGLGYPLIFDGATLRRSAGPPGRELPPGCMGTYNNGRLVMVLPDRRSYIAGDLVYNTNSGTPPYNYRDSILKINDNLDILAGQPFAVPINAGQINALFSVAIPDTSLGQGPLHVGTRKGVFGVNLPLDATLWTTLQQPTQVVSLPSAGPLSQNGVAVINTDAWYRAKDGIRSFQIGRRDMNTWVQTPLSFEMERVLSLDTERYLGWSSAVDFDNRLLTTCSPYHVKDRGVAARGLVALDFNNISSLTTRAQPAYDGLWTGLNILQVLTAEFNDVTRCFVFALDKDNEITLYELVHDKDANFDFDGTSNVLIESWIESNGLFGLESEPDQVTRPLKKLVDGALWFEELAGDCQFNVQFRSDAYPFWIDWHEFHLCATACEQPEACTQPEPIQYQYATYQRLPMPNDRECNPVSKMPFPSGYYFQTKVAWTGHAELHKAMFWANPIPETVPGCPSKECSVLKGCTPSLFSYSIE